MLRKTLSTKGSFEVYALILFSIILVGSLSLYLVFDTPTTKTEVITGNVIGVSAPAAKEVNLDPVEEKLPEKQDIQTIAERYESKESEQKNVAPVGGSSSGSSGGSSSTSNNKKSSPKKTPLDKVNSLPKSSFAGTDFYEEKDLKAVKNLVLKTSKGKIDFGDKDVDVSGLDLDSYIEISDNKVVIDSNELPSLNQPAILTLNIDYDHTPVILMDGKECTQCEVLDYSGGEVVFTVPHFTEFTTASCNNIADGAFINFPGDYTLCPGTFNVADLDNDTILLINSSDVTLDCQDANIIGDGTGTAISVLGGLNGVGEDNLTDVFKDPSLLEDLINEINFVSNIEIRNCNIDNFAIGMNLTGLEDSRITSNEVQNTQAGILFGGINSLIDYNTIHDSEVGIGVIGVNNTIEYNELYNNNNGLGVVGFGNIIKNNNASNNNENGIVLMWSTDSEVTDNNAFNNLKSGINTIGASDNEISGNTIDGNSFGISMGGLFGPGPSSGNIISDNTITNNIEAGMEFRDGTLQGFFAALKNMITHMFGGNNFVEVPHHQITESVITNNLLDNPRDFFIKGDSLTNNQINNNHFHGKGLTLRCSLGNQLDSNEYLDTAILVLDDDCSSEVAHVHGTILDENGNPAPNVQLSFYNREIFNPIDGTGDYNKLQPKLIPDAVTDENGEYSLYLQDGTRSYHLVMNGSFKIDFDVHPRVIKDKGHDSDIFENDTYDINTDFNVQGHIVHSGTYEHSNNYTNGQYVEFKMFGRNNGATDVTITYAIEYHPTSGTPTDDRWVCQGVAGPTGHDQVLWCSDVNNVNESLYLPADGDKYDDIFAFQIPPGWESGKYDIHVYDNSKWGKMHKIGNFFVIKDTVTIPSVSLSNLSVMADGGEMYSDETYDLAYISTRPPAPATIPFYEVSIMAIESQVYYNLHTTLDGDIEVDTDGDGDPANDVDDWGYGVSNNYTSFYFGVDYLNTTHFPTVYDRAKVHKARVTVTDTNDGSSASTDFNMTVFVTEDEGRNLTDNIFIENNFGDYSSLGEGLLPSDYSLPWVDVYASIDNLYNPVASTWDRYDSSIYKVGVEYISESEGITNQQGLDVLQGVQDCSGSASGPYIIPVWPSTASTFSSTLINQMTHLRCTCGHTAAFPTLPSCS